MNQRDYAFISAAFYIVLAVALLALGDGLVRTLTMFALLFGAFSQFAAQDTNSGRVPVVMSYVGVLLIFAAVVAFGVKP